MEAYRIEASVALRESCCDRAEAPARDLQGDPDASAGELAQLPRSDGP